MDPIAKHLYWWWPTWSNLISNSNLICYDKKGSRKWDNSRRVCCFLNCQKSNAIYFLLMVSYWHEACKAKYFLNSINIRGVGPFTVHPHWTQFLCFIEKVTNGWQPMKVYLKAYANPIMVTRIFFHRLIAGRGVSEKVSSVSFYLGSGLFGSCNFD